MNVSVSHFRIEHILLFKIYFELIYKLGSMKTSQLLLTNVSSIYNQRRISFLHSFAYFDVPPAVKAFLVVQFNLKWEVKSETKPESFCILSNMIYNK